MKKPPLIASRGGLLWTHQETTYFQFPQLSRNRHVAHAVFTRLGGASASPYIGLNTSFTVDDYPDNVTKNLDAIRNVLGARDLVFMNQSHGDHICVIRRGQPTGTTLPPDADALITNVPGTALMVNQADCQGVIIFDPILAVVGNVHCGWRGNVANILGKVVSGMRQEFGCQASDLVAAIGPSLGPCCAEFRGYREIFPDSFTDFMVRENHFDLWSLSGRQLQKAGLMAENIEIAQVCTSCNTDLFYSYRREGKTGRFGTVVMLRSSQGRLSSNKGSHLN